MDNGFYKIIFQNFLPLHELVKNRLQHRIFCLENLFYINK